MKRRKPGRPRGTTRGGSHIILFRVSDAEHAALAAEGNPNAVAKARTLGGSGTPTTKGTTT